MAQRARKSPRSFAAACGGLSLILATELARAQAAPPPGEALGTPPGPATGERSNSGAAPKPAEAPRPAEAPKARFPLKVEFYGALLPFLEHVSVRGATPAGFT